MRKQKNNFYNYLNFNGVINTPNLTDLGIRNWGNNLNNVYEHYDSYLLNCHVPNSPGPIEKHPYLELYQGDFDLNRETLLLGTFPPSSYFNNLPLINLPNPNVQNNNPTNYFYGNMNDLWFYLFGLNGALITIPTIQALLNTNSLSISDVFAYVQRKKMISAFDSEYRNIVLNCSIGNVFNSESTIQTLLFTSGSLKTFISNSISTLTGFRWILEDCFNGLENFKISGDKLGEGPYYNINTFGIRNAIIQQNGGIIWWLKTEKKKIRIINLPSPAPMAANRMKSSLFFKKWINYKATNSNIAPMSVGANVNNYINQNQVLFTNPVTKQYRKEVYQMVLNNSIHLI
jgi:hypothetical protein